MSSKFGELMGTALQIETLTFISWSLSGVSGVCQEHVRCSSGVSGVSQESVRSQSGVSQESVRSQSGVSQESVRSLSIVRRRVHPMSSKLGELIGKALQIWRAHVDSSPKFLGVCQESVRCLSGVSGVSQESVRSQSGVRQESVRSLSEVCQESRTIYNILCIHSVREIYWLKTY